MKVQASKVMANTIAKEMNKLGLLLEDVSLVKMSEQQFALNVGDPYYECYDYDYDWTEGKYKVIQITYPPEYYANPCYLTTQRLAKLFTRSDKSFGSFMQQIKNEIEI